MTEIPRHWRLKQQRYRLTGDYDSDTNSVAFPAGPNRPRFSLNGNGHHPEEKTLKSEIIYEAKSPQTTVTSS